MRNDWTGGRVVNLGAGSGECNGERIRNDFVPGIRNQGLNFFVKRVGFELSEDPNFGGIGTTGGGFGSVPSAFGGVSGHPAQFGGIGNTYRAVR